MKLWVAFVTWLSCNIVIASSINYPKVTYTTHLDSVGGYNTFITALRSKLQSGEISHGIPVLRQPSEITNQNKFVEVELINYDSKLSITLAVHVLDVYVIAFKTEGRSYFLKDAPVGSENLLFDGTQKTRLTNVETNYATLPNRDNIPLGIKPLKTSIDTFHNFDGRNVDVAFRTSLVVLAEMVAEAARFKFIQQYIENKFDIGYTPKGDTISFENSWRPLSKQIQLSGASGEFPTRVQVQNADYSIKNITNVAEVKLDIAILLYNTGNRIVGDGCTKELVDELLAVYDE